MGHAMAHGPAHGPCGNGHGAMTMDHHEHPYWPTRAQKLLEKMAIPWMCNYCLVETPRELLHVANEGPNHNEPDTDIELHLCVNCYYAWVMDQYRREFINYWERILQAPTNR